MAGIQDTRQILAELLHEQNVTPHSGELGSLSGLQMPYAELRHDSLRNATRYRSDIVFISGRFRSGSTLLWNIFRSLPSVTSYYEPFNERRWFDNRSRGARVDPTHLNVSDYWAEYEGLDELGEYYDEDWTRRHLYMSAQSWNPAMQRYVEILVERAKGRPVLQFNRADLRLPWLRARFPHATILHVYRHPRDQWCSTLGRATIDMRRLRLRDFEPLDGFYLLNWGRDLRQYFPFLTLDEDSHPYELFYQIWKLSYGFGRLYADFSISYEEIVADPAGSIEKLLAAVSIRKFDLDSLVPLVSPLPLGRWRKYGCDDLFGSLEQKVDEAFANYFSAARFSAESLSLVPTVEQVASR